MPRTCRNHLQRLIVSFPKWWGDRAQLQLVGQQGHRMIIKQPNRLRQPQTEPTKTTDSSRTWYHTTPDALQGPRSQPESQIQDSMNEPKEFILTSLLLEVPCEPCGIQGSSNQDLTLPNIQSKSNSTLDRLQSSKSRLESREDVGQTEREIVRIPSHQGDMLD